MDGNLEISDYLRSVIAQIRPLLRERLVGFYLYGSLTMGSFRPGRSDVDAVALVSSALTDDERARLRDAVAEICLPHSVRGLDLGIVSTPTAGSPSERSCWEAMLQVGRSNDSLQVRERDPCDPRLPLDLALLWEGGIALVGPGVEEAFARVPSVLIVQACTENIRRWANRDVFHDPASGVLNACRAWLYLEEGRLASKPEAGKWALSHGGNRELIEGAMAAHRGEGWEPPPAAVLTSFFQNVLDLLERRATPEP